MPDKDREERSLNLAVAELRVEEDGTIRQISGYAAIFNTDSLPLGWGTFTERIAPGAFTDVLASKDLDVRALVNHDPNQVIGRSTAGTLALTENKRGLKVEITPPDTQIARDLLVSIKRGDIDQMSFAFRVGEETWEFSDDPETLDKRTITKVAELLDVSPVTYPAYPDTSVGVKRQKEARAAHDAEQTPPPAPCGHDAERVALARARQR